MRLSHALVTSVNLSGTMIQALPTKANERLTLLDDGWLMVETMNGPKLVLSTDLYPPHCIIRVTLAK